MKKLLFILLLLPCFLQAQNNKVTTKNRLFVFHNRLYFTDSLGHDIAIADSVDVVSGSMVYPPAGISLSTGTGWGSAITDNHVNWNTVLNRMLFRSSTISPFDSTYKLWVKPPGADSGYAMNWPTITQLGYTPQALQQVLTAGGILTTDNTITNTSHVLTYSGGLVSHLSNSLGITPDDTKGLRLINSTSSTNGNQQISPALHWVGHGWQSSGSFDHSVDFRSYVLPVQNAGPGFGKWLLDYTYDGGTYTQMLGMNNTGILEIGKPGTLSGSLQLNGVTSGTVGIKTANAAGTWDFTLPTNAGTNLYVLQTDGAGVTSWVPQSGGSPTGSAGGGLSGTYPNPTVATATAGFTVSGGALALGTQSITTTGSIAATGSRVTKIWTTDIESTNAPTVGGVAQPTPSSTTTFTNKRWTARVGTTTSSATPTINTDNTDIYKLTAQSAAITSFTTNLSGTPSDGDILVIQITGTAARAITWGASFVSSTVTLPATTVTTATLTVILEYFTTSSYGNNKWVCANFY